jgi:hypothetical protein
LLAAVEGLGTQQISFDVVEIITFYYDFSLSIMFIPEVIISHLWTGTYGPLFGGNPEMVNQESPGVRSKNANRNMTRSMTLNPKSAKELNIRCNTAP